MRLRPPKEQILLKCHLFNPYLPNYSLHIPRQDWRSEWLSKVTANKLEREKEADSTCSTPNMTLQSAENGTGETNIAIEMMEDIAISDMMTENTESVKTEIGMLDLMTAFMMMMK